MKSIGAKVELWTVPEIESVFALIDPKLGEGETGPDGKLRLAIPRSGDGLLVVDHPAHPPRLVSIVPESRLRVILAAGKRISGRARPAGEIAPAAASAPPAAGEEAPPAGEACASWTTPLPALGRSRTWTRCAALAGDGAFVIEGLSEDPVELTVEVPGFLPARVAATAGTERVIVELREGIRLEGKVWGKGSRGVAGALVRAAPELAVESGADGSFLLTVPNLPVELTIEATGYLPARQQVPPTKKSPEVVIQLVEGQVLAGDLLGDEGMPIPEATFWTHRHTGGSKWTTARHEITLAEGRFSVVLSEPGLYRLRVQAEGYRETRMPELEVASGQEIDLGTVVLARGGGVRGTLVDELTDEGLAGGTVELIPRGSQIIEQALRGSFPRAISEDDGSFELRGVEAGSYELRVKLRGYAPDLRELDLEQDELEELGELVLGRGVAVAGRVSDRAGRAKPGVRVSFYQGAGDSFLPIDEPWTDADGSFEGPTLAPGAYQVRVQGERLLLTQGFEIPEGVERHELELTAGGVSLAGMVTRDGAPVDGGFLTLTSELDPGLRRGLVLLNTAGGLQPSQSRFNTPQSELMAEVGIDGTFAVEDVPPGDLLARFYGPTGSQVSRRLHVPDRAEAWVVLELEGVELVGTVVDHDSEAGLEASVRLLGNLGQGVATTVSDLAGRFELSDLEPGTYRLEVAAADYRPHVEANLPVESGRDPVVVRLEPGGTGTLAVQLRRADGSPMARVQFTLLDSQGVMVRSLLSDWSGELVFEDLSAGEYVLVWSDTLAGTGASPFVRVTADETTSFRASLPPAAPVSLRCEPALCAGQSLQLLQVLVPAGLEITPYLSGTHVGMRFSEGGNLALGRLTPGRYLVRAGAAGLRADRTFQVEGTEVVVALE